MHLALSHLCDIGSTIDRVQDLVIINNQSAALVTIDQSQAIILTKSLNPTWLLNVDFILARTSFTSHGLKLNVECLRFAEVIWYKCLRLMFDHTQMSVQFFAD